MLAKPGEELSLSEQADLRESRRRVAEAYSPDLLRDLGQHLVETLARHLSDAEQGRTPVLNWNEPAKNIATARGTLPNVGGNPRESLIERFQSLIRLALDHGHNLHNPGYIGHQVPAPVPIAGLFDALGAITNQVMAIYEMGPWATAVERALIEAYGARFGLDPTLFSGLVTSGGSLANLTALLTARNVSLGDAWERGLSKRARPPVLLAQGDSHYSVARAAGILGLGTEQVIRVPLDSRRRMDAQRLDELLGRLRTEGVPVIAVCACACATPIGAFDPLYDIADVCRRHEVWMHVDAAHGGAAVFSRRHRHLVHGLERADSFICDAHKTLFVPALCAFVFYREGRHRFEAFRQEAPYLFDPSAPGMAQVDSGLSTLECTKRAATFGLWGLWSMFGPQLFEDLIDTTFSTARMLYDKLVAAPDFEPLHEPEANIVVFRYRPDFGDGMSPGKVGELNLAVRRKIIESGEFYIVQTNLDGVGALRVSVMNPLTDESHLDRLLDTIRQSAAELRAAHA